MICFEICARRRGSSCLASNGFLSVRRLGRHGTGFRGMLQGRPGDRQAEEARAVVVGKEEFRLEWCFVNPQRNEGAGVPSGDRVFGDEDAVAGRGNRRGMSGRRGLGENPLKAVGGDGIRWRSESLVVMGTRRRMDLEIEGTDGRAVALRRGPGGGGIAASGDARRRRGSGQRRRSRAALPGGGVDHAGAVVAVGGGAQRGCGSGRRQWGGAV